MAPNEHFSKPYLRVIHGRVTLLRTDRHTLTKGLVTDRLNNMIKHVKTALQTRLLGVSADTHIRLTHIK
jgi:hypothetical protein